MAEPTDDQRRSAREIVDGLFPLHEWLARPVRDRVEALPAGLSIGDLESHAAQFQAETGLLEGLGCDFPAMDLADEHRVPVSLSIALPSRYGPTSAVWPAAPMYYRTLFLDRYLAFLGPDLELLLDQLFEMTNLVPLNRKEAEQAFVERASESLSHRVATAHSLDRDPPALSTTINIPPTDGAPAALITGCQFTVNTKTSGLRVFWSGAYYIAPSYFGAPTTPTVGTLQSGTYVFGVDGGAYMSLQWDKAAVCSLPGQPSVHLNF